MTTRRTASLLLIALAAIGCHDSADKEAAARPPVVESPREHAMRDEAGMLLGDAGDIQDARDRIAEAAALTRLQKDLSDHGLTFTARGERVSDGVRVPSLSEAPTPIHVTIDIFHGQQRAQSFSFVPRDNHNLSILGQ